MELQLKNAFALVTASTGGIEDLKKSDKFIKQLLEERERERKKTYLEHQKLLTEKEKGLKSYFRLLIYLPVIVVILIIIYLIIFHWELVK